MSKNPRKWLEPVVIIGLGAVGRALAVALATAGVSRLVLVGRNRKKDRDFAEKIKAELLTDIAQINVNKGIIVLFVQDEQIEPLSGNLAKLPLGWSKIAVLHVSGPLGTDVLAPLSKRGAATAAWHPYQTFPQNSASPPLAGVTFGITGDARGKRAAFRLTRAVGGAPLTVREEDRMLYHASAVFACAFMAAQLQMSEQLLKKIGVSPPRAVQTVLAIARQTLSNIECLGASAALTGPAVRGDHQLIRAHLTALKKVSPEAAKIYREMTKQILREKKK